MAVRLKKKFQGKDGGKHPHAKDTGDFPKFIRDPQEAIVTSTKQYLGLLDTYAPRLGVEVQAVLTACRRLMQALGE